MGGVVLDVGFDGPGCRVTGELPAVNILFPLGVFFEVTPEEVSRRGWGFTRFVFQSHLRLSRGAAPFAAIARRAGGHEIIPVVAAAFVSGCNMVDGEMQRLASAVLASVIIAPENFAFG